MRTEYHCHILPGIDDGARDVHMAYTMVQTMVQQGVSRICATPHFYAHRERSVARFLEKRAAAYEQLQAAMQHNECTVPVYLGAEVAIEHGISELKDIQKLAIEGTGLILLELPYRKFESWMMDEIYNFRAELGLQVMLAHVHRYLLIYKKDEMEQILSPELVLQINIEAFSEWRTKRLAKRIIKTYPLFTFGSDAHDLMERAPAWDYLEKCVSAKALELSDSIFDQNSTFY